MVTINEKSTLLPVIGFPEVYNILNIGVNAYESSQTPFESLCETSFLMNLFEKMKILMKDRFNEYNFYIYSYGWKQDALPNSVFHEYEKKKILIYISDESGNVPYYLAPYYYCIFKVYLQLDKFLVKNIFNFPLGYEKHIPEHTYKNISERKYSVFFIRKSGLISLSDWQLKEMILAPLQSGAELYPAGPVSLTAKDKNAKRS
jgi:hypothetical protein